MNVPQYSNQHRMAERRSDSERASKVKTSVPALTPTIFHEGWWLDTVTNGAWDKVEVRKEGRIVGWMPFQRNKNLFWNASWMPMLTHLLGPVIESGAGSLTTQFLNRLSITRDLIAQLPSFASFEQKCHRGVSEALAFQAAGFVTSVEFTCEIAPRPIDEIWAGMRDKTRNAARKGSRHFTLDSHVAPSEFCSFYRANLSARGKSSTIDLRIAEQLMQLCISRDRGLMLLARDHTGSPKGGIFCVWDDTTLYYLLSTRSLDSGNGAITTLVWHAIQIAVSKNLIFDFDGLAHVGAVLFYAGFGGEMKPRYLVKKAVPSYRLAQEFRRKFRGSDQNLT